MPRLRGRLAHYALRALLALAVFWSAPQAAALPFREAAAFAVPLATSAPATSAPATSATTPHPAINHEGIPTQDREQVGAFGEARREVEGRSDAPAYLMNCALLW